MPINKPEDRLLKSFVDEAPRMFLHLMEIVPLGAPADLEPLPRETAAPVVMPDSAMRVKIPGRRPFIFHTEMERSFRKRKLRAVALYGGGLMTQYGMPVKTVILLLHRDGNPKFSGGIAECSLGGTRILHPYRIFRMWELDPAPLLQAGDPRLLPWATMMCSTDREVRAIGRELGRVGNEELLGRFYMLASVRYDRDQLEEMTGDRNMGIVEFLWENSKILKEFKVKLRSEIRAQSRAEEASRLLRAALASKFPGLEAMAELDEINKPAALEDLLVNQVVSGSTRATVRRAIQKAARQSLT